MISIDLARPPDKPKIMIAIFFKTIPFFAIIGLGYFAVRRGMFTAEATAYLTKFVFYFALSAMLFRFSSSLSLGALLQWNFIFAYLLATGSIYLMAISFALLRRVPLAEAAVEAQCGVIGNVGFLGIPMLAMLLGPEAVGYVMLVLAVDLIVFSSLIVIFIEGSRDGSLRLATLRTVIIGLLKNPMIVSISLGLFWSAAKLPMP
jgi:predicted permease